ncbi:hypothetical protein MTO96_031380 [Rhipicephalus appendiculatus]
MESAAAMTGVIETPSDVASAGEHVRGRQLSKITHLAGVPEKERSKGRRKARSVYAAPEVLDAAVAHTPTGHTLRASVCVDGEATPGPPDPIVMPSAVVCKPSRDNSVGAIWRGTGARPKDRRTIPPDQPGSMAASGGIALRSGTALLAPSVPRPSIAATELDPQAARASEAEMAHTSTAHAFGASALRVNTAPSNSPVPAVRTAAVVRGPADGNSQGSIWTSSGVRRRGRRTLPSDLFDSSDSEEDPAFCGGSSSFSPPNDEAVNTTEVTAAPVPAPGSDDTEFDSEHKCPEGDRTFASKIGLSQHRRDAHIDAYNADIDIERSKPRCTREEEYLMAIYEVQLRKDNVRNINQRMAMKFSSRTFHGIKSHRRQERYQALVEEMLARSDGPTQRILDQDDAEPLRDDHPVHVQDEAAQPEPIVARRAISEELLMLVNKPPPRAFQGYRLWEITKRFLNGEHVGSSLDSYHMERRAAGGPTIPLLFNLVLDEYFEAQPAHIAFESDGLSVSAMAFADIILTASTKAGLQRQLDLLDAYLRERGLEANATKSRTLTITQRTGKEGKS